MSQLGRISGPLLKANLLRNGVDLAFETDLLYLDVKNLRVGIKTANPTHDLTVNGTTRTTNLELTNSLTVGNLTFGNNTISSTQGEIQLNPAGGGTVFSGKITADEIDIFNNTISTNISNANLEFRPHGTGSVDIYSNATVNGDLHVTGNVTADGDIQIGNQTTDTVSFTAEIVSDIIPKFNETYSLGSDPGAGGNRWNDVWAKNLYADAIFTSNLVVNGINLTLRQGKIYYVATNGNDTYSGTHENDPYATVKKALTMAVSGDTVYIYPGTYTEIFPLTVPVGVSVKGIGLRSVFIQPTSGTRNKDAFQLNGETTIEDITVGNFEYDSVNNTGHGFVFAPGFKVTTRSPYIKNVTVLTFGSTVRLGTNPLDDPRGYLAGDAGRGAFADGSLADPTSIKASMLFHSVTFLTPGADGLKCTNGVRIEWLNCFTYFASKGINLYSGSTGFANDGKTRIEFSTTSGTFNVGDTVTYYDTDGTTVLASGLIESKSGNVYTIDGKSNNWETITDRGGKQVVVSGDAKLTTSLKKFGTASLSLDGTTDYINIASQPDFAFGTGDFTMEGWFYPTASGTYRTLFDLRTTTPGDGGGIIIGINNLDQLYFYYNFGFRIGAAGSVPLNQWSHIALSRVSGVTRAFVNGTQIGVNYTDSNNYAQRAVRIGADPAGQYAFTGYVDDVRISKGVGRYTSNFSVPTNAFVGDLSTVLLLHFNGPNASTIITDDGYTGQDIRSSSGGVSTRLDNVDYTDFGAELRSIGSACVYGQYGIYGDGVGVIGYLIGQNLAYIGLGRSTDNDPLSVIQANEVVKLNGAKIFFNSVDARGDFRVGDYFYINQQTGEVSFSNSNVSVTGNILLDDGLGNVTYIDPTKIDTGNIEIAGNTISSVAGDVNINAFSNQINLLSNVTVSGNLDVTGNVTVGGNITIGDQTTDTVNITAKVTSDIIPTIDSRFNLGSNSYRWNNLYSTELDTGDIRIFDNVITTVTSNSDLELTANGTGKISIPTNDLLAQQNLTVQGTSYLANTDITGSFTLVGNSTLTGTITQTGNYTVNGVVTADNLFLNRLSLQGNQLRSTQGNENLVLSAAGTGKIYVPNNNVVIDNNLTVNGTATVNNFTVNNKLTADSFATSDVYIKDNFITTTLSNSDLELRANGTGRVLIPNNNTRLDQDLTVNGTSYLKNTNIVGTVTHTGNTNATGNLIQTGTANISGSITIGDYAQFADVRINNNSITTTLANSDLTLIANGTGKVIVPNNNVIINNGLTVIGNTQSQNITATNTITSPVFTDGDIRIEGNLITTTLSNSDLELAANGTGKVVVPNNNVDIANTLTVNSTSYLSSVNVTGTINHTGNTIQTGNLTEVGNFTLQGTLTVDGISNFANVNVQTNNISSRTGNSDLNLIAAGTGKIYVPNNDVVVEKNLTVTGNITATSATINQNLVTDNLSNGNIDIQGNLITTTLSNSDLELRANGTGSVSIPNNVLNLGQSLYVTGTTNLATTNITGTLTQVGTVTQTGTVNQTGNYTVNGLFNINGTAQFKDVRIQDNFITTTLGNNDLVMIATGTGIISMPTNNVSMSKNLSVLGNISANSVTASDRITAPTFVVGNVQINGNSITTNASNTNLQLTANGTGFIEIEQVLIRGNTITTPSNTDLVLQPTGTGIVNINTTQALKLPAGNDSQRPAGQAGMIRYNTQTNGYEGYDGTYWRRIDGVYDVAQTTYITGELTPGANDNIIRFYVNGGTAIADLNASRFRVPSLDISNINITGDTISSTGNSNITFAPTGSGSTVIGNFAFKNNLITNTVTDSITYFNQTGNGYFKISGTNGFVIPTGTSGQRGGIVETGMIRFNTTDNRMEIYDGTQWGSAAGSTGQGITITEATDVAIVNALIFG
jgi:hypothetical protein